MKIRDIHKIEEKNCFGTNVFDYKIKSPLHKPRSSLKKHFDLLLTEEKDMLLQTRNFIIYKITRSLNMVEKSNQ